MGDGESDEVEEIHEQLPHNTSEATQNVNDLIGVSIADNDFFEVDVDNHIDEEDEEGEDMF
jgi:RNA-splicing ligase RtcB